MADLHDAARWRVDHEAGPDRSAEIAALAPRANVEAARAALRDAQLSAIRAKNATRLAQSRVTRANVSRCGHTCPVASARRHGEPPRASSTTHDGHSRRRVGASNERFGSAKPPAGLANAERATLDLVSLRQAQVAREAWIAQHPAEVAWERDLRAHRGRSASRSGPWRRLRVTKRWRASQGPLTGVPSTERPLRRAPLDPVTEAVLKRPRPGPAPQPVRSPRREGAVRER